MSKHLNSPEISVSKADSLKRLDKKPRKFDTTLKLQKFHSVINRKGINVVKPRNDDIDKEKRNEKHRSKYQDVKK